MAETTGYMVLGYAVALALLLGLVIYLVIKRRNVEAELKTLQQVDETGKVPTEKRDSQSVIA